MVVLDTPWKNIGFCDDSSNPLFCLRVKDLFGDLRGCISGSFCPAKRRNGQEAYLCSHDRSESASLKRNKHDQGYPMTPSAIVTMTSESKYVNSGRILAPGKPLIPSPTSAFIAPARSGFSTPSMCPLSTPNSSHITCSASSAPPPHVFFASIDPPAMPLQQRRQHVYN